MQLCLFQIVRLSSKMIKIQVTDRKLQIKQEKRYQEDNYPHLFLFYLNLSIIIHSYYLLLSILILFILLESRKL